MTLRVTFDTNVLDLACRPDRFPKDTRQPHLPKVRDALATGRIHGFYSVTMLTIEGIMRKDRASVFAGTNLNLQPETVSVTKREDLPQAIRDNVRSAEIETIKVKYVVKQPGRKPLHPEVVARIEAARALGVRVLKAVPRIGAYSINDPHNEFYLDEEEGDAPSSWVDRIHEVARAIEDRGLGIAQVEALGGTLIGTSSAGAWFSALANAKDIHEERAIERAFGEWADADAIAAHVAYGLDVFCSADVGNSNAVNSILDPANRAWLTTTYAVKFMTFDDLLNILL